MNARDAYSLIEKLKALPPQRQAEVEDFSRISCAAATTIDTSYPPPPKPQSPPSPKSGTTMTMPSMTAYNFGDVILVPFPFTDQSQAKQRPLRSSSAPHATTPNAPI